MNSKMDYFLDMTDRGLMFDMVVTKNLTPDIYRVAAMRDYSYAPLTATGSYDDEELEVRFWPVE